MKIKTTTEIFEFSWPLFGKDLFYLLSKSILHEF